MPILFVKLLKNDIPIFPRVNNTTIIENLNEAKIINLDLLF